MLEGLFALTAHDAELAPARERLLLAVTGCAGLVTMLTDRVDEELFEAAGPSLRVVANYAVGVDNVDLAQAERRGIVVTNTPDVLTDATAELTIALVLALLRRVGEGDRLVRRGATWNWAPTFMLARGLRGLTLGCVGFGGIGREVGRRARSLGMEVVYTNRSGPLEDGAGWLPLPGLLERSDVVTLHCPLTPETRHLIDGPALERMRPGAVLVNTARGPVVDERALVEALAHGRLAGVALDVYEAEPSVPQELLSMENVVLLPHLGSATLEARTAMGMLCVEALRSVLLDGTPPRNAVGTAESGP